MIGNSMGKFYACSNYLHLFLFDVMYVIVRFIFSFFSKMSCKKL